LTLGRSLLATGFATLFALASLAFAQAPAKPAAEDPRFEIRRYVFEGATLLPVQQLEEATRPFTGLARNFGDVQRALEVVERAYTQAGYSAVQVILPEQELERGEVRFQIVEAKLGRVIVEGNKFFDEANIRASVPSLVAGQSPNINAIARNLRVANESPAKQTNVLLRSGQQEATVDAVMRVVDENTDRFSVTLDNSGTKETGSMRLGLGYQNANAWNRDHVLTVQYVTAPYADSDPQKFGWPSGDVVIAGAGYRIPFYEWGDSLDFSAGYSNVNSGQVSGFSITGAGYLGGLRYTRNFDRIGDYEHRMQFAADYRYYDNRGVRAADSADQLIRDYSVHPLTLQYVGLLRGQDSETSFSLAFSQNFPGGNDGTAEAWCDPIPGQPNLFPVRIDEEGNCATPRYNLWRGSFNRNQALPGDWQARFAMNGQYTHYMLASGEMFGIGGADSVRGFLERQVVGDRGYRGTLEVYTPDFGGQTGIAGARMRALAFVDWGGVFVIKALPGVPVRQNIGSAGLGIRFSHGTNLSFRLDIASVWDASFQDPDKSVGQGTGESRAHASFSYVF
jgi:hemolysin activation/secretion protein